MEAITPKAVLEWVVQAHDWPILVSPPRGFNRAKSRRHSQTSAYIVLTRYSKSDTSILIISNYAWDSVLAYRKRLWKGPAEYWVTDKWKGSSRTGSSPHTNQVGSAVIYTNNWKLIWFMTLKPASLLLEELQQILSHTLWRLTFTHATLKEFTKDKPKGGPNECHFSQN